MLDCFDKKIAVFIEAKEHKEEVYWEDKCH